MERTAWGGFLWAPTHYHPWGILRCAGGVGCPSESDPATGVSQTAARKDMGEQIVCAEGRWCGCFICSTFVLFYYPTSWWGGFPPVNGERSAMEQAGADGFPSAPVLFCFWCSHIAWSMTLPVVFSTPYFIRWVCECRLLKENCSWLQKTFCNRSKKLWISNGAAVEVQKWLRSKQLSYTLYHTNVTALIWL